MRRSPYYALLPLWALIIAATMLITWHWYSVRLYDDPRMWIAAAPLFVAGLYLYRRAHENFTDSQLAGRPELEPTGRHEQRLVTAGIRRRLRHPIYLGHLLEMIAWAIGSGLLVVWGLIAFAIVTGAFMIRMEEHELETRFGDAYREYKRRVPAIVPRLGQPHSSEKRA